MADRMCPLLAMGEIAHTGKTATIATFCGRGECQWWNTTAGDCAVTVLAEAVSRPGREADRKIRDYDATH